jgi:hypothetical protein
MAGKGIMQKPLGRNRQSEDKQHEAGKKSYVKEPVQNFSILYCKCNTIFFETTLQI